MLEALASRIRRNYLGVTFGGLALFLLLGFIFAVVLNAAYFIFSIGAMGFIIMAAIGGIMFWAYRNIRKDLEGSTYLRTTGPMGIRQWYTGRGGVVYLLKLADCEFSVDPRIASTIASLTWGTVEHTHYAHLIFEVLDSAGQVIYRDAMYNAAPEDNLHSG